MQGGAMRVLVPVLVLSWLCAAGAGPVLAQSGGAESDCAMCHEEVVKDFRLTGHAVAPGRDPATGCQSCHGSGDEHMDSGGELDSIVRPQTLPPRESSDICLTCHQREERHFSARQAIHQLNDVGCVDCHDPHAKTPNMLAEEGVKLCAQCHQATAAEFELPRHHPMEDHPFDVGGPPCATCHEPHTTRGVRSAAVMARRVCGSCHFEKVGPFVYNHDVTLVDGCASCHMVHGSTNRHLLRHESQVNLCYECHSAGTTPGWHSAPEYVNKKCTACHTAIHGSNTSQFFLED
jgi:DmsE family decaheme c-type cytochrome